MKNQPMSQRIQFKYWRLFLVLVYLLLVVFVLMSDYVAQLFAKQDSAWTNGLKERISSFSPEPLSFIRLVGGSDETNSCDCNGENFCFKGLDELGHTRSGLPFDCSLVAGLKSFGLLDSDAAKTKPAYTQIVADDKWAPVFVTTASSNHFSEARKFVQTTHHHYPTSKIVFYDIGLKAAEVNESKSWCNVEYKKFDFYKYPPHFRNLWNYSFKLVILEALQTHRTFFYFDSSIRVTTRNLTNFLRGVQTGQLLPVSLRAYTTHSVYAATHPDMFAFLPLPLIVAQTWESQATGLFITDAPYTRNIFKWWYLCAMTKECIDPAGAQLRCQLSKYVDRRRTYINCHRFDQAYWNIFTLVHLFGSERGAVRLGYAKNWTELNENLVAQVEQTKGRALAKFENLTAIKRDDTIKTPLILKC